jgi:hypothetical protein
MRLRRPWLPKRRAARIAHPAGSLGGFRGDQSRARRPAAVICIHTTTTSRPPARILLCSALTSPSRNQAGEEVDLEAVRHQDRLQPPGHRARIRSARCRSVVTAIARPSGSCAAAALSSSAAHRHRRYAARADHARPERRHRRIVGPMVGAQHCRVMALPARHEQRPPAVLAHVAERHRLAGGGSGSLAHGRYVTAPAARGRSPVVPVSPPGAGWGRADSGGRIPAGSPATCWAFETEGTPHLPGTCLPGSGRAP